MKTLESLGIVALEVGRYEWRSEGDSDGETCWTYVHGTVIVTVKLAERETETTAAFYVSDQGDFTFAYCGADIDVCTIDEFNEDEEGILKALVKKIEKIDWDTVADHLTRAHSRSASEAANEFGREQADADEYNRDPYRYYGLSRSDFR